MMGSEDDEEVNEMTARPSWVTTDAMYLCTDTGETSADCTEFLDPAHEGHTVEKRMNGALVAIYTVEVRRVQVGNTVIAGSGYRRVA